MCESQSIYFDWKSWHKLATCISKAAHRIFSMKLDTKNATRENANFNRSFFVKLTTNGKVYSISKTLLSIIPLEGCVWHNAELFNSD